MCTNPPVRHLVMMYRGNDGTFLHLNIANEDGLTVGDIANSLPRLQEDLMKFQSMRDVIGEWKMPQQPWLEDVERTAGPARVYVDDGKYLLVCDNVVRLDEMTVEDRKKALIQASESPEQDSLQQ